MNKFISKTQKYLDAAGYLDINEIKESGEYKQWGTITSGAYENAVRDIMPEYIPHDHLEFMAVEQPAFLDPNLVAGLEAKAEERGKLLRQQEKKEEEKKNKKEKEKKRAEKIKERAKKEKSASNNAPKSQAVKADKEVKPTTTLNKPIL